MCCFAFPDNKAARDLQAAALEQLGYQAERGSWRNFYLTGAQELRHGVRRPGPVAGGNSSNASDLSRATPVELFLDYVAIQMNGLQAKGKVLRLGLDLTDGGGKHLLVVENSLMNHWADKNGAEVTRRLTRAQLSAMLAAGWFRPGLK